MDLIDRTVLVTRGLVELWFCEGSTQLTILHGGQKCTALNIQQGRSFPQKLEQQADQECGLPCELKR